MLRGFRCDADDTNTQPWIWDMGRRGRVSPGNVSFFESSMSMFRQQKVIGHENRNFNTRSTEFPVAVRRVPAHICAEKTHARVGAVSSSSTR